MNLDEMRRLDAIKTYKELEEAKEQIKRLEQAGDHLCAAAAFMGWHDKIEDWNKAKESKQ